MSNEKRYTLFCKIMDLIAEGYNRKKIMLLTGIKGMAIDGNTITIRYPDGETVTDWI